MGNPTEASAAPAAPAAAAAAARPRCEFGEKCFRKNPDHKAEFSHVGDPDWDAQRPQRGAAGYSPGAAAAPAAPYPDGETEEDRGLMGGLAGAAAAAGGLGAANHFGAFAGKVDPNDPGGKAHGFAQDHKLMAGALAVGGVLAAGLIGSKIEDGVTGGGKHGKNDKKTGGGGMLGGIPLVGGLFGGKKKTGKKKPSKGGDKKGGKKDKKTKSRDIDFSGVQERGFDPNAEDSGDSESSYETGPEDEGYDPKVHSDGRPRTP